MKNQNSGNSHNIPQKHLLNVSKDSLPNTKTRQMNLYNNFLM